MVGNHTCYVFPVLTEKCQSGRHSRSTSPFLSKVRTFYQVFLLERLIWKAFEIVRNCSGDYIGVFFLFVCYLSIVSLHLSTSTFPFPW